MKLMPCPLNGLRNISEFSYGGEVKTMPNPQTCSHAEWADYVFNHDNTAGVVREWWLHNASNYWFIAERHTVSDEIIRTFDPTEIYAQRVDFAEGETV
ncbi:sarcosine oxidase subunit delta [Stenoxybacter acetivorans]|uniref:sarcosine oxidase subunit delta n=1 Tax=Stenoxybacter acetivorans TaxID=422441 RepID=UPI00055FDDEA|nr:sarcosine oxidase subunit delta [Stenoxybacter acetivorans]